MQVTKRFSILLVLSTLTLSVLFPLTALATSNCTCFDADGKAQPVDATYECFVLCNDDPGATAVDGSCNCPIEAMSVPLSCEDTCTNANYSTTPSSAASTGTANNSTQIITPRLSVDIPTVDFSEAIEVDGKVLNISFLGAYIAGFYEYILGMATIAAIVMVMIGGLQYAAAGGYGDTSKAKERIKNDVIGLVLLSSTYLILWTVNPELVRLRTISLDNVAEDALMSFSLENCEGVEGMVTACSATSLATLSGWEDSLASMVNSVADETGADRFLMAAHLQIETSGKIDYDSSERGPCGEIGIAQFMPTSFETTVGQDCCVQTVSKDPKRGKEIAASCELGFVAGWPPNSADFPNCNATICGTCQVAMTSCAEYFDTNLPGGVTNWTGIHNTLKAQASFVKKRLDRTGDLAMAMCAYNGSGAQAAHYAQKVAQIYLKYCTDSGG